MQVSWYSVSTNPQLSVSTNLFFNFQKTCLPLCQLNTRENFLSYQLLAYLKVVTLAH